MAKFTPPPNLEIDNAVLALMQKDLDGYLDTYRGIVDKRHVKYAADIRPLWKRINKNITTELKAVYNEVQDANGVPITRSPISQAKYRNMQRKIQHLATLQQRLAKMLGVKEQDVKLEHNLAYQYTHAYYHNAYGLEQAVEVAVTVPELTEATVMGVLANPWLPDGATYSDRIRSSSVYLAGKMEKTIVEAVGNGWDWNRTARQIQSTAQEGYYNSVRLARTELNRAAAQGASDLYMQNADLLDGKRWNAALDSRTAPKDAANDGKQYPLEYDTPESPGMPGERIPNHPNCRCSWTPIISSLGVSTKERIARGKGDSTDNFGERIYTKARTYEEYAKERGLPALSERLANDKPSSYLRRGEKLSDYGAPVGINPGGTPNAAAGILAALAAKAVAAPVVAKTWVENVKDRIAGGVNTEADVREVGAIVRKRVAEYTAETVAASDAVEAKRQIIIDALNATDPSDYEGPAYAALRKSLNTTSDEYYAARDLVRNGQADRMRDVLKDIRQVGSKDATDLQEFVAGSSKDAKASVEIIRSYLPTDWVQASNTRPLKAKKSKRGYYQEAQFKDPNNMGNYTMEFLQRNKAMRLLEDTISLSGEKGTSMTRCTFHEMGHRMEDMIPGIRKLEAEFYARRTAGETPEWLGPGYKRSETTRKDKFLSSYMGKDYGNKEDSFYELLSMGLESAFKGSYELTKDDDYADFIYGLMAAL